MDSFIQRKSKFVEPHSLEVFGNQSVVGWLIRGKQPTTRHWGPSSSGLNGTSQKATSLTFVFRFTQRLSFRLRFWLLILLPFQVETSEIEKLSIERSSALCSSNVNKMSRCFTWFRLENRIEHYLSFSAWRNCFNAFFGWHFAERTMSFSWAAFNGS